MPIRSAALLLALLAMHGASAQSLEQRFLTLAGNQGVDGHEADVRANIRGQLPAWSRPQVDSLGNLQLSFGRGAPHTVLVAPLDESGYVVSRITNDGYLRLHRHTAATGNVLRDQFAVGQPVQIRTASGRMVAGVTATPSLHLSRLLGAPELRRIRDIGDLWVDVGAANAGTVAALGVRNLDPVNLRERAQPLANGRVAGLNAQWCAGAQTLVEFMGGLAAEPDGSATLRDVGGMYLSLYEALPVCVQGPSGHIAAVIAPRADYATSAVAQPADGSMTLYFGTGSAEQSRALGVAVGQGVTLRKRFVELANQRATGRAMDDRVGIAAILLALKQIDPGKVGHRVTIAFSVEEETGLSGAQALAKRLKPDYAFAFDTFVSTDTPSDPQYLAYAPLGKGPVLRGMDNRILTPATTIDRIMRAARGARLGVTQGGVDSSAFSAGGVVDVGLSWPGRYSHSGVEVVDQRDLEELARLLAQMMKRF
jgi:putative aminopeptidase FrvX